MICENCASREATTHIKRVVNGNAVQLHLCGECAGLLGYGDIFGDFGFDLRDLFSSLFGDSSRALEEKSERCTKCGCSFNDIVKSGCAGCSECYRIFADKLSPTVQRIHGKAVHTGKRPRNMAEHNSGPSREEMIEKLSKQMEAAVLNQNFEEAASLRDRIATLRQEG